MSTDQPMAGRTRRPATRRFRRRFLAVVVVLALVAALSAVIGAGQGPRLRDVSYSGTDLVTQPAQRVILTANQSVEAVHARDVTVSPRAAFTVSTSANAIAIQFSGPLQYQRAYRIAVRDVRAPGQAARATLTTTIRTGTTSVLSLLPGADGGDDRIVRRALAGTDTTTVFRSSGIEEFARVGRFVVVVRNDAAGHSSIDLVPLAAGGAEPVEHVLLPTETGTVSALHVADDGAAFGFVYADTTTGQSRDVGLYVVDMGGTHLPAPVLPDGRVGAAERRAGAAGADAVPMTVSQWGFVPRTESALVRSGTNDLFLVDATGGRAAVRLGSATYLHGFVGTGTTAVVETGDAIERLDLSTGRTSGLPAPAGATDAEYLGRIAAISADTYLRLVGQVRNDGTLDARVIRVQGSRVRTLPVPAGSSAAITGVCPSPNGQLAAVLTRSSDGPLVLIVDTRSGALDASIAATTTAWCQAIPSGSGI